MSSYQKDVGAWIIAAFGENARYNVPERTHRFLEEALELAQSAQCNVEDAHMLVDYVFGRPVGTRHQEIGGVCVTLASLCNSLGLDMTLCGQNELKRCWKDIEKIRAKQAAKFKDSALPGNIGELK